MHTHHRPLDLHKRPICFEYLATRRAVSTMHCSSFTGGTYLSVKTGVLSVRLLLHGRSSPSTWSRSCSPSRISSRPSLLRLPVRRHRLLAISHGGSASTVQVGQQYILHSQQSGCKPTQTGWLPVTVSCSLVRSEERWPCSPL